MLRTETTPTTVGSRVRSREGLDLELEPAKVGFELSSDVLAIRGCDVAAFAESVDAAAEELTKALMQMWATTMSAVTDATGNVVDAGGSFSFEAFYEMLDKMEFGVTPDGELELPVIVAHPDVVKK